MSLLQGVLRTQTLDSLDRQLGFAPDRSPSGRSTPQADDSDEEFVNVVSLPGTPSPSSRPTSRPTSPTRGAAGRPLRRMLHPTSASVQSRDPLRVLPTDLSQRIFARLTLKELANCARVSKKWSKSQTLNYVWFQHYRKENFHDESLPPGKWTKRESKQNWRTTYLQSVATRSPRLGPLNPSSHSGYSSPSRSGQQTPREAREEKWRLEADAAQMSKVEMREMYKELGGRKARGKNKLGGSGGIRDRGGWAESGGEW
ncbi:hypothetical protein B0H21DRAFT_728237 [Amylocystis lapponica]|nr:hypothetical protein B0H21DRAFT_728237 [Amylocystis lapponica]